MRTSTTPPETKSASSPSSTTPNITSIAIISEPVRDNNTYGIGETIEIEATFSTSVDVDGNPGLGLRVDSDWRSARYLRGSGSDKLVFGYTVKSTDSDTDGIRMPGGYQDNDGRWHNLNDHTAITASGTEKVVSRVYAGIDDQSGHKVDGSLTPMGTGMEITSEPASGDTYRYGETIEFSITFSAALDVEGSRHLSLRVGSDDSNGWRGATYRNGSGTNTLVFGYTVQTADLDTDGVSMRGYCQAVIDRALTRDEANGMAGLLSDKPDHEFFAELRQEIFGGKPLPGSSADLIREAREITDAEIEGWVRTDPMPAFSKCRYPV